MHRRAPLLTLCAVMALSSPAWTAEPSRSIVVGQEYKFYSAVLGGSRTINVFAPRRCAEPHSACPVVYLLDGGVDEDFLHVVGTAQVLAENNNAQNIIIVGIADADRRHDLTSPSTVADDLRVAPTSGAAQAYRRFLVSELKPWVAAHFPNAGRSALMGESLGGFFTLETALNAPSAFEDYVVVSPSIWWNGGALAASAKDRLAQSLPAGRRLWLDFEEVAPPGAPPSPRAIAYRAQQDALGAVVTSVPQTKLASSVRRSTEGHGAIYPKAVFDALRDLYPAEKR